MFVRKMCYPADCTGFVGLDGILYADTVCGVSGMSGLIRTVAGLGSIAESIMVSVEV